MGGGVYCTTVIQSLQVVIREPIAKTILGFRVFGGCRAQGDWDFGV